MPPFDEGDLLFMPTTLPGVGVDEAARVLRAQDEAMRAFPEVLSVYGKAGRADTATDPAPLEMVETVVRLRPRDAWRRVPAPRWWSGRAPAWAVPALRVLWPDERPKTLRELAAELAEAARLPGYAAALTMPIRTRVDMLSTGIRSKVGVKVLGDDLEALDRTAADVARVLAALPATRSAVAEPSGGALHVDVVPRDEALARYGVDRADVLDFVELAVGGALVTTLAEGRVRTEVRVRFDRDRRLSLDALRALPIPVRRAGAAPGGDGMGADPAGTGTMGARTGGDTTRDADTRSADTKGTTTSDGGGARGAGMRAAARDAGDAPDALDARRWLSRPTFAQGMPMGAGDAPGSAAGARLPPPAAATPPAAGMGGAGMGGGGASMGSAVMGGSAGMGGGGMGGSAGMGGGGAGGGVRTRGPLAGALSAPVGLTPTVALGDLAEVTLAEGPSMIRSEGGRLAAFVYVDVDEERQDLAGYVADARRALRERVRPPAGVELRLTGQYEELERTRDRLAVLIPATVLLVLLLLYLHLRSVVEVLLVALTIPFALVGSVWALWLLDYRLSAAVAVGVVALVGLAASTGIVMVLYLDQAYLRRKAAGLIRTREDIVAAHEEGTVARVRPKVMTVATTLFGLLPLLWADGTGADVMKRIAAPMVGGLFSSLFLTLEILPVVYTYWRTWELRRELRTAPRHESRDAPPSPPAVAAAPGDEATSSGEPAPPAAGDAAQK
jgi:Cu/Ag efflux pump CusA